MRTVRRFRDLDLEDEDGVEEEEAAEQLCLDVPDLRRVPCFLFGVVFLVVESSPVASRSRKPN